MDLFELENYLKDKPDEIDIKTALKCIVRELYKLQDYHDFMHNLIPLKFKKAFPKPYENPFFTLHEIKCSPELLKEAKDRMNKFLEKSKEDNGRDKESKTHQARID